MRSLGFDSLSTSTRNWVLVAGFIATIAIYWPGLSGGYIFDDYPNIVDNHAVQPDDASLPSMTAAALSSPSSRFKRPLSSLSFAGNYLLTGLDPFWMKATNLIIHLINGLLVYSLSRILISRLAPTHPLKPTALATIIAIAWLVLPINLTAVVYVVQRMESLAHLFVLAGLLGYCQSRLRMLNEQNGAILATTSLLAGTGIGLLAKETAILLPLYALLVEVFIFRFRRTGGDTDWSIVMVFVSVLALPLVLGLAWQLGIVLKPATWAARDFTLYERLLSEARIVCAYIRWALLPTPQALSFYHDDFVISRGLFAPWTTVASIGAIVAMIFGAFALRKRHPLAALGIALYLGAHTLTGTILPLELIYEHRNYFASLGLLLTVIPPLLHPHASFRLASKVTLCALLVLWGGTTALTAHAWGHPLRLAEEYAARAPQSPRAQYALAQTYIVASDYDPQSPFLERAWPILEEAAILPHASILPEQALIFSSARVGRRIEAHWWESMVRKLNRRRPASEDQSAIMALARCARERKCELPPSRMVEVFLSALNHPSPPPRVLAAYGDYAWNVLQDKPLALKLANDAAASTPTEPEYLITLLKMQIVMGQDAAASQTMEKLNEMNIGGRLNNRLRSLIAPKNRHEMPAPPRNRN